jgi:serine/threonine protein phosphatase PrpC
MRLDAVGATDVGRKRPHNEDSFLVLLEESLFCVADGLGGHASGEVASRLAVEEMAEFFRLTGRDEQVTWPFREDPALGADANRLAVAIRLANLRVHERSRSDARLAGMGTTVVSAHFTRRQTMLVAHVGDSRAYLFRDGALQPITEDHSLLATYIRQQSPSAEQIEAFPHKNVIVRALGMREAVEVDLVEEPVQAGDVLLLCCDGLSGMLPDDRIAGLLRAGRGELRRANQALVDAANEAGGADNITSLLVQVLEA